MKAVNHSWWIGAIISTVLTLTLTGGPAQDNPGMLILIGVSNGVFWGWIIGLIIDKVRASPSTNEKIPSVQTRKPSPIADLRRDGYYLASGKFMGGETKFFVFFFTSKGFVALGELDEFDDSDLTKEEYKHIIAEGEALNEIEVSPQLTKYSKKAEQIDMTFYDPTESSNIDPIEKIPYDDPVVYNKWSGKIIRNGLLLDLEVSRFSYALKDYEKQYPIQNLKFDFVPVGMN